MLQDIVCKLHNAVALSNALRLARYIEQAVETLCTVFNRVSELALAPAIFFVNRTAVVLDKVSELADNSIRCLLFQRFNDEYDFVLSHEITSSLDFGPLSPGSREGSNINSNLTRPNYYIIRYLPLQEIYAIIVKKEVRSCLFGKKIFGSAVFHALLFP